jgi:hypothetical protein
VMLEPPVLDGAFQSTVARALPAEAVTFVGAPGTVRGVPLKAFDDTLLPTELCARTFTEYVVPLSRSEMVKLPVA